MWHLHAQGMLAFRPGPVLADVKAALAARDGSFHSGRQDTYDLIANVAEALSDEAVDIVQDSELDMTEPTPVRSFARKGDAGRDDAGNPDEREPVVVRHRFDKRKQQTARRIITLRDHRRGRPAHPTKHGSGRGCS